MTPSFSSSSVTKAVTENTVAVGRFAASDPDVGDVLTYSLSGPDAALFEIDATTGDLRFKVAPDFESLTPTLPALRALSESQRLGLYQFFTALMDAAPGVTYFNQIGEAYQFGLSTQQLAEIFSNKTPFLDIYPTPLSNQEFATSWIDNLVGTSATPAAKADAVNEVLAYLNMGWSRGKAAYSVSSSLTAKPYSDPTWGETAKLLNNQIAYAKYYTESLRGDTTDFAALQAVISRLTPSSGTEPDVMAEAMAAWGIGSSPQYSVTVTATDSTGLSAQLSITVLIADVADGPFAPIASAASFSTAVNTPLTGLVLATDQDSLALTYSLTTIAVNGNVVLNSGTGEFTYTPFAYFSGSDTFTFKASDGVLSSTAATVSINVTPVSNASSGVVHIRGALYKGWTLKAQLEFTSPGDSATTTGIAYQWRVDGVNIPGANSATLALTDAHIGKSISVLVAFTDQQGSTRQVASVGSASVLARIFHEWSTV